MKHNFEQKFLDAVERADISYLREYVTNEMYSNPVLFEQKADSCMHYIREKRVNIEEAYQEIAGEEPVPTSEAEYSRDLFYKQVEYLRRNFAYDDRKPKIEKIGKAVFAAEAEPEKAEDACSFKLAPLGCRSSKKKSSPAATVGLIALIVAIVAAIGFFLRK